MMGLRQKNSNRLPFTFWKLWSASSLTNLGDGISGVALPLLAAQLTHDPFLVTATELARFLPLPFFSLFIGVFLDRFDRKQAKIGADLVRFVLYGFLALMLFLGWANLYLLYGIAFLVGIAEMVADSASPIMVRHLVAKEHLERAYGRIYTGMLAADSFIGPPMGGWLFASLNSLPFLVHGFLLFISAALISTFKQNFRVKESPSSQSIWDKTREGLGFLWSSPLLRTLALTTGLIHLVNRSVFAIFVLYALETLGLGEAEYGLLSTAFGIGGIVGSLIASNISRYLGRGPTLLTMLVVINLAYIGLALTSSFYMAWILVFLLAGAIIIWGIVNTALRQLIVPDELLGRVGGAQQFLGAGATPLGSLLGGIVAKIFGLSAPFWLAGSVAFGAFLWARLIIREKVIQQALQSVVVLDNTNSQKLKQ
ncbi:MAG: MFS transporter [Prochloraceae cyanobacterium]